jgi:hypothetical protein
MKHDFLVLLRKPQDAEEGGKLLVKDESTDPIELLSVDAEGKVEGIELAEKIALAKAAKAGLFDPGADRVPEVRMVPFRTAAELKACAQKKE